MRYCLRCRSEYQGWVNECNDCDRQKRLFEMQLESLAIPEVNAAEEAGN
jgi:hypothetical protein